MEWMMGEGQFMRDIPTLFPSLDLLVLAWSSSLTHFCIRLEFCIRDDWVSFQDCSLLPWKKHLMWLILYASNPNIGGFQSSLVTHCLGEGPVWVKCLSMSHYVIYQVNYVAAFDDFSIVDVFSLLIPIHVGCMLNSLQYVFGFSLVFGRNCPYDSFFVFLHILG